MHSAPPSVPIIDTHIHLYDPTRPDGVPWPEKTDAAIYKPALPARYEQLARPEGIVGAIAIECSPRKSDNWWVLEVAAKSDFIVGHVGDLEPESPSFKQDLDQLHRNPLFLGIRYGNLWNRDLGAALNNPAFVDGVRLLASYEMVFESANPNPGLIAALRRLADLVPEVRIVIDHLPGMERPRDAAVERQCNTDLEALGKRPQTYAKISEVVRRVNGTVPLNAGFYQPRLDWLWQIFGEDKLMLGSDWPNSDHIAPFASTLQVAKQYIIDQYPGATQKVFYKNSTAAYRWKPRTEAQRRLIINS